MNDNIEIENAKVLLGDCLEVLSNLPSQSAQTCVTSPPYFGLRDYGHDGQMGLEPTSEQYVANMVSVFREVRRVLADDGTLWLNIGDSYARAPAKGGSGPGGKNREWYGENYGQARGAEVPTNCKPKDLIGIPWMLAFALRADGWYLRQDIIWHKPNPMPESVRDRCTKAHEYIFLLSKSERYFYDHVAAREDAVGGQSGKAASFKREGSKREQTIPGQGYGTHRPNREDVAYNGDKRNRRSVWTVATRPYKGAHFATFPPALIEPCILAGSRPGDVVLDPFNGSGTTGEVALTHGRGYLGIELNPEYLALTRERLIRAANDNQRAANDNQAALF
nr:site-specific DNA-methyltransferase [Aminobacter aminovorans]